MKLGHCGSVGKLFEDSQPEGQSFLNAGALLTSLHLLQLLEVFVQLQVVEDDSNEKTQHDLLRFIHLLKGP